FPVPKTKQITAWVESKPGALGRIAQAFGNAKVNITAFTCWGTGGESPIHLQVSSLAKAKKVLQDLGLRISEGKIVRVTLGGKVSAKRVTLGDPRQSPSRFNLYPLDRIVNVGTSGRQLRCTSLRGACGELLPRAQQGTFHSIRFHHQVAEDADNFLLVLQRL